MSRVSKEAKEKWKSLSHVQLFATPWTIQSMEFSRPEYWSGYPFPSPGDVPNSPKNRGRNVVSQGWKNRGKKKNQGGPWNAGMEKNRPLLSFPLPLHVVAINEFQVLLSSITCLPSYPIGRRYLPFSSPTQYTCLIQSANDPQDHYPAPCTLDIKMDQGFPFNIGCLLSQPTVLIASPTVINYSPLMLPHVWKFFSNLHTDHDRKDWGHEEKGTTEDEMVGWHHCVKWKYLLPY